MCICTYIYVHVNIIYIHTRVYSYIKYIYICVYSYSHLCTCIWQYVSVIYIDRHLRRAYAHRSTQTKTLVCKKSHACGDGRPRLPMNDPLFLNAAPRPLISDGDDIGAAIGGKDPGMTPLCKPNVCTYMPNKQKNAFECSYVSMLV